LGDPLKGNLLLFYKPLHLVAQQVSTRIEVRRHQEFHKMAQNFGMIANYAEKAKSTTTEGVKLLEGRVAEPEMKKPRVEISGGDKVTEEEEEKATTA
jgi:hypothetical protein